MTPSPLHQRNFLLHIQERQGYDRPVLIKEPARDLPNTSQINQLHNEYAICRRLAEVAGVRLAYAAKEGSQSHPVLLLEYVQDQIIIELIRSSSLELQ